MFIKKNQEIIKIRFKIFLLGFFFSFITIIATIPIHESAHWIMSDIDPFIEPVEYHVFDNIGKDGQEFALNSVLGYVLVKEKYPGSLKFRPFWANFLQEIICISLQIIISFIITLKFIITIEKRYVKNNFIF